MAALKSGLQGSGRQLKNALVKWKIFSASSVCHLLSEKQYLFSDGTRRGFSGCGNLFSLHEVPKGKGIEGCGSQLTLPTSCQGRGFGGYGSQLTAVPNTYPFKAPHNPVMAEEVVEFLAPARNKVILDMTFGGGGHSRRLLGASPGVRLVCLDRDPTAFGYAKRLQKEYPSRVLPLLGRFSELPKLLTILKLNKGFFDGVLMDLGASSMQFNTPERGFMLSEDGPLDMRMDNDSQITAADVLSHLDEDSLYKVLKYYGEERHARPLARAMVEARYLFRHLSTTKELAEFVASLVEGEEKRTDKLQRPAHVATKVFQALRILVNNELNELDNAMKLAHYYLCKSGVLVAITFHSLEDTIVKRHLQGVDIDSSHATIGLGITKHRTALSSYTSTEMEQLTAKPWSPLTKHVVLPSEEEVNTNPRARSAKLRAAVRV